MRKNGLTLKIIAFLAFSDILETFTQFCFKKSAVSQSAFEITSLSDAFSFIRTILPSHFLWLGLLSVILTFIIWSTILSKIDLSVAVPIASLSYILVPLVSLTFLGEKITALRWTGILFILIGVMFVSMSTGKEGAS